MAVPEFPLDALDGTDEELGKLLLAWFIASEADIAGIALQEIPEEFGKEVVTALHTAEATVSAIRRGRESSAQSGTRRLRDSGSPLTRVPERRRRGDEIHPDRKAASRAGKEVWAFGCRRIEKTGE